MPKPSHRLVTRRKRRDRKGAIVVLSALFMVIMILMVAFVVDLGYVVVAQTELQRSADAAAHAAAMEYRKQGTATAAQTAARNVAAEYVLSNEVAQAGALVDKNWDNLADGDVVCGRFDFSTRTMNAGVSPSDFNAVQVRIRRNNEINGKIPLFFARVVGHTGIPIEATATAAILKEVGGFQSPSTGERVPFLPITVQIDHYYDSLEAFEDNWSWNNVTETASNFGDGIPEINIYPESVNGKGKGKKGGDGSNDGAGNYGTLNVGTDANSTSHLGDVIRNGLTEEHFDHHGGQLELDSNGELGLSGDPGISAGLKDDLSAIIGKPVIIPLYSTMEGTGNNAQFTIVKFVGVRLVEVDLTGGQKVVMAQPADVTSLGVIPPAPGSGGFGSGESSYQIFSPVSIVQ